MKLKVGDKVVVIAGSSKKKKTNKKIRISKKSNEKID